MCSQWSQKRKRCFIASPGKLDVTWIFGCSGKTKPSLYVKWPSTPRAKVTCCWLSRLYINLNERSLQLAIIVDWFHINRNIERENQVTFGKHCQVTKLILSFLSYLHRSFPSHFSILKGQIFPTNTCPSFRQVSLEPDLSWSFWIPCTTCGLDTQRISPSEHHTFKPASEVTTCSTGQRHRLRC